MLKNKVRDKKHMLIPTLRAGSLNRAVIVLEAIAQGSRKGSLLTELIARTSLPRPTIYRILNMLIALGWIERDENSSRFNLGKNLAALGYSAISRHSIEQIAAIELNNLASKLNQVVYLSVRSGLDVVCVGRYEGNSEIQVGKGWVGMRGPFGMTPACMGMFARLPVNEVHEIVNANMSRYYDIEGFNEKGFRKTLNKTMETGHGIYNNIILDHTASGLGVAICEPSGYPIAGIGTTYITGWLNAKQQKQCLSQLISTASKIEKSLFQLS